MNQKSLNKTKNFFDYSLSEKKKIINSAAKNATKMQLESLKPKELDWENKYLFYQKIVHLINKIRTEWDGTFKVNKYFDEIENLFEKEVSSLLDKQKEQILNLECLKEEEIDSDYPVSIEEAFIRNQLRNEIKEAITNLK